LAPNILDLPSKHTAHGHAPHTACDDAVLGWHDACPLP
jgi:hypothetical protein